MNELEFLGELILYVHTNKVEFLLKDDKNVCGIHKTSQ